MNWKQTIDMPTSRNDQKSNRQIGTKKNRLDLFRSNTQKQIIKFSELLVPV